MSGDVSKPWVLGIASSHNGAVCLLHGDEIVVAIQEERLPRLERAPHPGARKSLAIPVLSGHRRNRTSPTLTDRPGLRQRVQPATIGRPYVERCSSTVALPRADDGGRSSHGSCGRGFRHVRIHERRGTRGRWMRLALVRPVASGASSRQRQLVGTGRVQAVTRETNGKILRPTPSLSRENGLSRPFEHVAPGSWGTARRDAR
jgi:hypothetical protein